MKGDGALDLLHELVDVAVQNGHRTEPFQQTERLFGILGTPAPSRIDRPQGYMGKDDDRRRGGKPGEIVGEPGQLLRAKLAKAAGLQIDDVDKPNEPNTAVIEGIISGSLGALAVAIDIGFAERLVDHVVLAGHIMDVETGCADQLACVVEFDWLGQMGDVAGMQHEGRLDGEPFDFVDRLAERCPSVRVGWLFKADVAVADLDKAERGLGCRGGLAAEEVERARYAAAQRPYDAGSSPNHTFQGLAAIERVSVIKTMSGHVCAPLDSMLGGLGSPAFYSRLSFQAAGLPTPSLELFMLRSGVGHQCGVRHGGAGQRDGWGSSRIAGMEETDMGLGADPKMAMVAFNRFGLGARPGDLAAAANDPRGYLKSEVTQPAIADLQSPDLLTTKANLQLLFADQEEKRLQREMAPPATGGGAAAPAGGASAAAAMVAPAPMINGEQGTMAASPPAGNPASTANGMANPALGPDGKPKPPPPAIEQKTYRAEILERLKKQYAVPAGFVERLVGFWSNHFAISVAKGQFVRIVAGSFEREAIRPYVLGSFSAMLKAVEQHPAMLFYLDNQQSMGPNSQAGRNRSKGLNENLAREILELHTLGVGAGYSQSDVTNFARIITGWTFAGRDGRIGEPGTFAFFANAHEPGSQVLLGRAYTQPGVQQGEAALGDLARHPATATHIATKLVRHFIADEPPPDMVARLAGVFRDTEGNLQATSLALLDLDAAWTAPLSKIRTPYEFLIAGARAQGRSPDDPGPFLGALNALGMGLWQPPGPNGFGDSVAAWASPEGMKVRLDIAAQMAQRMKDLGNPLSMLDSVAGPASSPETRQTVARAESRQQALALLFMSPEFQRR
jgi:uncharacterized protein (DUF1800 family)